MRYHDTAKSTGLVSRWCTSTIALWCSASWATCALSAAVVERGHVHRLHGAVGVDRTLANLGPGLERRLPAAVRQQIGQTRHDVGRVRRRLERNRPEVAPTVGERQPHVEALATHPGCVLAHAVVGGRVERRHQRGQRKRELGPAERPALQPHRLGRLFNRHSSTPFATHGHRSRRRPRGRRR